MSAQFFKVLSCILEYMNDKPEFDIPDIQVDKVKFDGILRKIAGSKPLPAKELIGKLPTSRVVKRKPSPSAETEGPGSIDGQI
jgi:hypothetical protein